MQKITLTRVYRNDKDKNGVPLISKTGKPYTKVGLQTVEHGDAWLSGFENSSNKDWKEGDVVEVIVTQQQGRDGKVYLNFETPRAEDVLGRRVSQLEVQVMQLINACTKAGVLGAAVPNAGVKTPNPSAESEPNF